MTTGDGVGQFLEVTLAGARSSPRWASCRATPKQDPCSGSDRFHDMRRIAEVRWTFDGGHAVTQTLDPESATMQTIDSPTGRGRDGDDDDRATTDAGAAGLDYSPVSEVTLS